MYTFPYFFSDTFSLMSIMFAFLHFITFVKLKKKTLHNSFVSENIFFYIRPILLIFFKSKQDYEGKN